MDATDELPGASASSPLTVTSDISFTEFVEVTVDLDHPGFRELVITLESPSGLVSELIRPGEHRHREGGIDTKIRMGSASHLGENPNGTWTLHVTDHFTGNQGLLNGWEIKVYGHHNSQLDNAPIIEGEALVGETLAAITSGISDKDGMETAVFSYQWVRNDGTSDAEIQDATGSSYTLQSGDVGNAVRVRVTFTDDEGKKERRISAATAEITAGTNNPATGLLTISGALRVGETLTVDTSRISDSDGLENATFTYRWSTYKQRVWSDDEHGALDNPSGANYTVSTAVQDRQIYVLVSFTDDAGNEERMLSGLTAAVAINPPTIIGRAQVGYTLTADISELTTFDGLSPSLRFRYRWIRSDETGDTTIEDADNSPHYTLSNADAGKAISVRVEFSDDDGSNRSVTSAPTSEVEARLSNTPATGKPVIVGALYVGDTLTADLLGISDADGLNDVWFVSWWYRKNLDGKWAIVDTDNNSYSIDSVPEPVTYAITAADLGNRILLRVTFADDGGNQESKSSGWSEVVTLSPNPASGAPTIMGTVRVGETLTADVSGIADDDGLTKANFSYQWISGDTDIDGARSSIYTLKDTDAGKAIRVRVSFTDDANNAETLTSAPTAEVPPRPNSQATGQPTISGTARVGETLTAHTSAIADSDGVDNASFRFQWVTGDADIDGATDSTYTLIDADEGKTVTVRVSFTDDRSHQETLTSAATAEIAARPNRTATGMPTIIGVARAGNTLTANTSGITDEDGIGNTAFHYSWLTVKRGQLQFVKSSPDPTYTIEDDDEGKTVRVWVAFVDDAGHSELRISEDTDPVQPAGGLPANSPATGAPTISGTAQVDETLTASPSGIADADGLVNASFSYQWIRNDGSTDADIEGATDSTYDLSDDDEGKTIRVRVSFTDDANNDETVTSAETAAVVARPNSLPTGLPSISGTAQVGETLTASPSGIADADGLVNASFSYQWIRNNGSTDTDIQGAKDSTYDLSDADGGKTIRVRVSFTDDANNEETLTSVETAAVAARPNSPPTGLPSISGTAQVSETLTASPSGIADADGLNNVSYSYQWIRNDGSTDTDIEGATDPTYEVSESDVGKTIQVRVSFTDDADNDETLTSVETAVVAPTIPTEPLSLTVTRGGQIQELDASWQAPASNGGSAITGYKVRWNEAADSWDTAGDLSEATVTGTSHTITGLTGGVEYAVRVMATNGAGDGPASSETTGTPAGGVSEQNTEPENNAPTGLPTIGGTAQVGETLTADTPDIADADGLDNAGFGYRWIASNTDILDARNSTYTLKDADEGKTIKVRVSFTDDVGNNETLTSAATAEVAAKPDRSTMEEDEESVWSADMSVGDLENGSIGAFRPDQFSNVGGSAGIQAQWLWSYTPDRQLYLDFYDKVPGDEELTLQVGGLSLPLQPGDYNYSWDDVDVDWEDGQTLAVRIVRFTETAVVVPNTYATGAPTINGTAQVDETLTADTSGVADEDGIDSASFSYQWLRNDGTMDSGIPGATGANYTLRDLDEGKTIRVRVSFTDDANNEETLTSAATAEVEVVSPDNSLPTGLPTISGTAQVDETLTAGTSGIADEDGLGNPSFSFQWVRNDGNTDTDIQDATASTYTLRDADVGKTIKVRVSFTDDANNQETLTSAATDVVAARSNTPPTDLPTITGTAQVDETLTAGTSGIADEDGLGNPSFSFQWVRNDGNTDTDIQDATASTYTLRDADVGKTIKVRVSFTDDANNEETLTSEATAAVAARSNSPPTGLPSISGTARVGETLTASPSGIADADGLNNVSYSYQWIQNDADIEGATDPTYEVSESDVGKTVKVRVSFTDDANNDETLTSAETAAVAARSNSPATGAPTISGTAQVDETLTASVSAIEDADGLDNVAYSYQWIADDANIQGAIGSTYTLADSDEGKTIQVRVSFTDAAGNKESLTSAATGAVAPGSVPDRPTGLTNTATHNSVTLTWDDPGDSSITHYQLFRRNRAVDDVGVFHVIKDNTGSAAATYTDSTVDAEGSYVYRVKAVNRHGASVWSGYSRADIPAAP